MVYDNTFTCPSGHTFNANAKLRARCPECGKLARRFGKSKEVVTPVPDTPEPDPVIPNDEGGEGVSPPPSPPSPEKPKRKLEVLKVGKPREMPRNTAAPKKTVGHTNKKPALVKKVHLKATAKKKLAPKVSGKPKATAIARHIAEAPKSYADEMIARAKW